MIAALSVPMLGAAETYDSLFKNGVLRFNYTGAEIKKMDVSAKAEFEADIKKMLAVPDKEKNFENTLLAFENAYNNYYYTAKALALLTYFHDKEDVREAAAELESEGSKFKANITSRKDIYNALKKLDAPSYGNQEKRLYTFWINRFERAGAKLDGEEAKTYAALTNKKMELITKYNVNLMNDKQTLELTKEELAGMSDLYINRLQKTKDGKYIVTMKYPDYNPFMQNAENENARKALQIKFANRGGPENVTLLEEVLEIRSKTSRMLGFKDHPQYVLADRMAKDEKTLRAFLKDIQKNITPAGKEEKKNYLEISKKLKGKKDKDLTFYNYPYYSNIYLKENFNLDKEAFKEYFPSEHVVKGMMDTFGEVFSIKFEPAAVPTWHKDVMAYKITDAKTGALISHFYLDLYPRDGKYTHAAAWTFIDAHIKPDGTYQTPSVVVCSNMNPPGGGAPSLLSHEDVVTLFHEFGHVLQMSMTKPKYASLGGDNMSWDYVETHSQLLENWAWDKATLKKISKHYKTGEPLPDNMIDSLIKSRTAGAAFKMLRQNFLGQLDLAYHKSNKHVDSTKVYYDMVKKIWLIPATPGTYPQGSFGHIMSLTDP